MTTSSRQRAQRKRREVLIGLLVMGVLMAAGIFFVLTNAGKWGVPGFTYRNDYGSVCENGWLSDTCTDLSVAEINAHTELQLPEEVTVLSGSWEKSTSITLLAELTIPQDQVHAVQAAIAEKYGHCRTDIPPPAVAEGMADPCVMASDAYSSESASLKYSMALGYREDQTDPVLVLDFYWR